MNIIINRNRMEREFQAAQQRKEAAKQRKWQRRQERRFTQNTVKMIEEHVNR